MASRDGTAGAASPVRAAITRAWPGSTSTASNSAATSVKASDTSSHASPSTPICAAVAMPNTGTATPSTA